MNKPIKSVTPDLAMSSEDREVIGEGPSISVLLICEPVTYIRSTELISSDCACTAMLLEMAVANNVSFNMLCFIVISDRFFILIRN